jgi:hypothetical protein
MIGNFGEVNYPVIFILVRGDIDGYILIKIKVKNCIGNMMIIIGKSAAIF